MILFWASYPSLMFFDTLDGEQIKLLFTGENILSWKNDLANVPVLLEACWDGQLIIGF